MDVRIMHIVVSAFLLALVTQHGVAQTPEYKDPDLARDLELMQGSWELLHGDRGDGPTIRSVKTTKGNRTHLRRFRIDSGEQFHEHTSEFQLSKSGAVRVFTFYRVGESPEDGGSFIYRINKDNFWDVPGLFHGDKYRNYSPPAVYHWKRVTTKNDASESPEGESQ